MAGLQISTLIIDALGEVRDKWQTLVTALFLPTLAIVLIETLQREYASSISSSLLFSALATPFYVLFAVVCHRTVILGEASLANSIGLFWSPRETRFLGWTIALFILTWVVGVVLGILAAISPLSLFGLGSSPAWVPALLLGLVVLYFYTRLSLVFPATATDNRTTLGEAWLLSSGNGWRLTVAIFLPTLVFTLVYFATLWLFEDPASLIPLVLSEFVVFIAMAVGICVLSVAYRELSSMSWEDQF